MDQIHHFGSLALGSRLKRLSDRFMADAAEIYASQDVPFEPRWFPLFSLLSETDGLSIGEAARALKLTHAAVSQTARDMIRSGVVSGKKDAEDERKMRLSVTPLGKRMAITLKPLWADIRASVDDVTQATGVDIISTLSRLERAMDEESISARTQKRLMARQLETVTIVDYKPKFKKAFRDLNVQWIERYFSLEKTDIELFDHVEEHVLAPGGHILFAQLDGELVGTVALLKRGKRRYELAKMAVLPQTQGRKIGFKLMMAAIAWARSQGAASIYLETNDSLTPAVNLYRKVGFVPDEPQPVSKYKRVNLVMTLHLNPSGTT